MQSRSNFLLMKPARSPCLNAHAGLLRADVLHAKTENAGELGQVVNVATGSDQLSHIALTDRFMLLGCQPEFSAIGYLVSPKLFAVCRAVEGKAHPVEREALLRLLTVEQCRAWNFLMSHDLRPMPTSNSVNAIRGRSAHALM